jgi:hypothetical protein
VGQSCMTLCMATYQSRTKEPFKECSKKKKTFWKVSCMENSSKIFLIKMVIPKNMDFRRWHLSSRKIKFDSRTNNLVGIVLPFDKNGMPIYNTNFATTAATIKLLMTKEKSTTLYIILAKPVVACTLLKLPIHFL